MFAEMPFNFGSCIAILDTMAQVTGFTAKVLFLKEALWRAGERPRHCFFPLHVRQVIRKEAIDVLDKANCL